MPVRLNMFIVEVCDVLNVCHVIMFSMSAFCSVYDRKRASVKFIQRSSKYVKTTHITRYGQKEGNSNKAQTVKACNVQPYNEFEN